MTIEASRPTTWPLVNAAARPDPLPDHELIARSIRRGVIHSMLRIRRQLMTEGEWFDSTILPMDSIQRELNLGTYRVNNDLVALVTHEHSMRWMVRQVRKAQDARGDRHN
jgi:hypothetical protein